MEINNLEIDIKASIKPNAGFLKKINKINKPLTTYKGGERKLMSQIRNEREIRSGTREI